jgi:hypothetical protein
MEIVGRCWVQLPSHPNHLFLSQKDNVIRIQSARDQRSAKEECASRNVNNLEDESLIINIS